MHSIIDKKSSLSRERLVDFTGELQVRCQDESVERSTKERCPVLGETYILPPWRPHYEIEPTVFGGRNVNPPIVDNAAKEKVISRSSYAQELAALPLENPVAEGYGGNISSHASKYDGLLMHTSFCNELICQPKMLQGCLKESIVVKIELRKLEWSATLNSEVAVPVAPSIHNARRGPWLVQEAFTSCAMDATDPRFLDEFKVKLPLLLGENSQGKLGLFFSVYQINVRKRRRAGGLSRRDVSDEDVAHIGSGFLPLSREDSASCLIENGEYEIPITLRAVELFNANAGSGHHNEASSFGSNIGNHVRSIYRSSDILENSEKKERSSDQQAVHDYPRGTLALSQLQSARIPGLEWFEQDNVDDSENAGSKDHHASILSALTTQRRRHVSDPEELQTLDSTKSESYDESLDQKLKPLESLAKGLRSVSSHGNLRQLVSPKSDCDSSTDIQMVLHVSLLSSRC